MSRTPEVTTACKNAQDKAEARVRELEQALAIANIHERELKVAGAALFQARAQNARLRAAAQESLQFATDLQTNNGMLVMRIEKLRAQLKAALAGTEGATL